MPVLTRSPTCRLTVSRISPRVDRCIIHGAQYCDLRSRSSRKVSVNHENSKGRTRDTRDCREPRIESSKSSSSPQFLDLPRVDQPRDLCDEKVVGALKMSSGSNEYRFNSLSIVVREDRSSQSFVKSTKEDLSIGWSLRSSITSRRSAAKLDRRALLGKQRNRSNLYRAP